MKRAQYTPGLGAKIAQLRNEGVEWFLLAKQVGIHRGTAIRYHNRYLAAAAAGTAKEESKRGSKREKLRELLAADPTLTARRIGADHGLATSSAEVSAVRKQLGMTGPGRHQKPTGVHPTIRDAADEIGFLRWWNQGERSGYVDRLLAELQRGHP